MRRSTHCQRGQALPFAVFLLVASTAIMLFSLNAGQMSVEKTRLNNAADAAAYSAGVTMARALNFGGYTNRAIIANEVAVAQALSAASWANYAVNVISAGPRERIASRVAWVAPPDDLQRWTQLEAAFIGGLVADYFTASAFSEYIDYFAVVVNAAAGAIITASSAAAHLLSGSQSLLYGSIAGTAVAGNTPMSRVANDVVRAMDPGMTAQLVPTSLTALGFVQRYADADRRRLHDTVMASLDSFTLGRNWDLRQRPSIWNARIERRGGTRMSEDFESWTSSDDLTSRWRVWRPFSWRNRAETLAGSAATVGNGNTASWSYISDYTDYLSATGHYAGLPSHFELRRLDEPGVTGISVLVEKPRGALLTSGNALQARQVGRLDLYQGEPLGNRIISLARAEVFFERPSRRADGRTEIASLFNPYWQVRLVAPTAADRAYAATQQGLTRAP